MDSFWHLLNLFGPALGLSAASALAVKVIWWRLLKSVSFLLLWLGAFLSSALVCLLGFWVFGVDGKMLTYGAMTVVSALSFWGWGLKEPPKLSKPAASASTATAPPAAASAGPSAPVVAAPGAAR